MGTLVHVKGHSDAIRAIADLSKRGVAMQLAIVGSGRDRASLERLAELEGAQERVFFTGFLLNPLPVMEASDVVLVCSRKEGFSRVTLEAMRMGKPVIGAASGAILELVSEGFNGLIYESGNYEQLAEKLFLLAQSPSLRMELGENGRCWAECFSLEAYGTTVLKHFNRALQVDLSEDRDGCSSVRSFVCRTQCVQKPGASSSRACLPVDVSRIRLPCSTQRS